MRSLGSLISEAVRRSLSTNDRIVDAIKKRYELEVSYDPGDGNPKGKGKRIIQPVAYGLTKAGNPAVRAWQPYGDTESKTPRWKLFRLDRISSIKSMRANRFKQPPGYGHEMHGLFNPNGDGSMSQVYMIADFTGKGKTNDNIAKYNEKRRQDIIDRDPYYYLKRNIKGAERRKQYYNDLDRNLQGNEESVENMSRINAFGDEKGTQTIGPVYKGDEQEVETDNRNVNDYSKASSNGPVYKGIEQDAARYDQDLKDKQIEDLWAEYEKARAEQDANNGREREEEDEEYNGTEEF